MDGLFISTSIDDLAAVEALAGLDSALADMTELMDSIGRAMVSSASERIGNTNTSPDGAAWPESLRVKINGGKTLLATGAMRASISHLPAPDHVLVGTNAIQAKIHQFGGVIRAKTAKGLSFTTADGSHHVVQSVTMPARPFIGVSADDEETIRDLTQVHFGEIIEALQ